MLPTTQEIKWGKKGKSSCEAFSFPISFVIQVSGLIHPLVTVKVVTYDIPKNEH